MIKLNENDYKNIIENCVRRLITEEMYDDNEEMTPFEKYAQDYPDENFNVENMDRDELAEWCLNNDFLYIFNPFGRWRISGANSSEIQEDIANDIRNCAYIEKTHEMDWLIENKKNLFGYRAHIAVFKLHNTKDGDYYVIHRFATLPSFQREGLARIFISKVNSMCEVEKIPSIKVDTNFDNTPMINLLSSMGFCICGRVNYGGNRGQRFAFEKLSIAMEPAE